MFLWEYIRKPVQEEKPMVFNNRNVAEVQAEEKKWFQYNNDNVIFWAVYAHPLIFLSFENNCRCEYKIVPKMEFWW